MRRFFWKSGVCCSFLTVFFAASAAYATAQPNPLCIIGKCGGEFSACEGQGECRSALDCVRGCNEKDPELQQACTIKCTESANSKEYDGLAACMVDKGCLTKSETAVCARPGKNAILAEMKLSDLDGSWYVIRGLSRSYDCWSCQKMSFTPTETVNQSRYDYDYIASSPRVSHIACTVSQQTDNATSALLSGRFAVQYTAHGLTGSDDWYVLSRPADDYALIYYCGSSVTDEYRGAIAISRHQDGALPAPVVTEFQKALQAADLPSALSLDDFCAPDNSACGST